MEVFEAVRCRSCSYWVQAPTAYPKMDTNTCPMCAKRLRWDGESRNVINIPNKIGRSPRQFVEVNEDGN